MNTAEITSLLRGVGCQYADFLGVFARDKLPLPRTSKPICLIANVDKHNQRGSHWIAMYINPQTETGSLFDPYGVAPEEEFVTYMNTLTNGRWIYNTVRLQSEYSTTCGQYCVMFVYFKCRGYTFDEFIDLFTTDTVVNDFIVTDLIRTEFGVNFPILDIHYLLDA